MAAGLVHSRSRTVDNQRIYCNGGYHGGCNGIYIYIHLYIHIHSYVNFNVANYSRKNRTGR